KPRLEPDRKHWLDVVTAIFAGFAMVATGVAAYFTGQQWLTAQDTERRQLRSYVFVVKSTMHDFVVGKRPNVQIELRNSGQTPAFSLVINLGISLRDLPNPGPFYDPARVTTPTPLGPGVSVFPVVTSDDFLNEMTLSALQTKQKAFFVFGTIKYIDAFG